MKFNCPECKSCLQLRDIKYKWNEGIYCGECGVEVRYSPPYQNLIIFGSSPVIVAALAVRGIERGFLASIEMIATWFLGSILVSSLLFIIFPPKLKLANDGDDDPYSTPSILR